MLGVQQIAAQTFAPRQALGKRGRHDVLLKASHEEGCLLTIRMFCKNDESFPVTYNYELFNTGDNSTRRGTALGCMTFQG